MWRITAIILTGVRRRGKQRRIWMNGVNVRGSTIHEAKECVKDRESGNVLPGAT